MSRNRPTFEEAISDAFCVMAIHGNQGVSEIQKMRMPCFFSLLGFMLKEQEQIEEKSKKNMPKK